MPEPVVIAPFTPLVPKRHRKARIPAVPSRVQPCWGQRLALNVLSLSKEASSDTRFTPTSLLKHAPLPVNCEHYANPMVHPVTGKTISSYKKLMHDPATADIWQTAFGKDFGGMAPVSYTHLTLPTKA